MRCPLRLRLVLRRVWWSLLRVLCLRLRLVPAHRVVAPVERALRLHRPRRRPLRSSRLPLQCLRFRLGRLLRWWSLLVR